VTDALPRAVVGTAAFPNPGKIQSWILAKLGIRVAPEEIQHHGGRVLLFHIPGRLRGSAYHLDGADLMRSGEDTVPMTEDRLRAIFAEGRPDWLAEVARPRASATDVVQLLDTQGFFDLVKLPYPDNRDAVLERLVREHLIAPSGLGFDILNLGAILFAKSLDDFSEVARKAPRVIVYEGTSKAKTRREQRGSRGYAVSFEALLQFVESQTPSNEVIGKALRKETRMYPSIMLRETIANALIHQDFRSSGVSVMVEIYDDRVEISNPGQPGVQVERLIDEYQSRNEQLADLMRRIGVCEEKGSGIDKVVDAAEAYQLPAPEFRVDNVRTTCILYGHRPFSDMTKDDRVRACYQHCCLRYVLRDTTTNQSLRNRFGLADKRAETVSRILRDAIDAGLVRSENPDGSRKYARYLPYWA
jgi:ATP-dependent DNA helicase RecG